MNDWWQQHEHSRPQRERRSEVEMNRPEGTGDPGGGDHPEIFLQRRVREQHAPQWAQDVHGYYGPAPVLDLNSEFNING